jgi:predicted PurR-regulated permease PerM
MARPSPGPLGHDDQERMTHHRYEFWRTLAWSIDFARRAAIWLIFFGVLWLLRGFFPLIFLTFVFAFVSSSGARFLGKYFPALNWRMRVSFVFVGFLILWSLFGWVLVPQLRSGYLRLREKLSDFPARWSTLEDELYAKYPWYGEFLEFLDPSSELREPPGGPEGGVAAPDTTGTATDSTAIDGEPETASRAAPDGSAATAGGDGAGPTTKDPGAASTTRRTLTSLPVVKRALSGARDWLVEHAPAFIGGTVTFAAGMASLLFLATLFSFLILLDLDALRAEVRKLETTRIADFYRATGASIAKFGEVLGKVLEAQAVIALANALLTSAGLWAFGVEPVVFLGLIVFVCGFVPVAGVFLSSVPICLSALYLGGPGLCLWIIVFIIGIHFVEAYILNPRIMGAALEVNPVLTLVILVIGHHAFGVWGMLLGLPVSYYFFTHVIRKEPRDIGLWVRYDAKKPATTAVPEP